MVVRMGEELWNNRRQLHANVWFCSLSVVLCVIMCTFPTNQTAAAQLLIVIVCSLVKRALMRRVGEQLKMWVVYVAQEANFICSLCNSLDRRRYTLTQEAGNNPHMSSVVFVEQKTGSGCAERALKLDFVPLCIITKARDPWCIAVSCWDCGQNDRPQGKILGACWAKP